MTKRLFSLLAALLAAALICTTLSSCSLIDGFSSVLKEHLSEPKGMSEDVSLGFDTIEALSFSPSSRYTPVDEKISYELLESDEERRLYDRLIESAFSVYPEASDNGYYKCKQVVLDEVLLHEAQIRTVIKAIYDDHPELFWLTSVFGHLTYTEKNYTAVQLYSCLPASEINPKYGQMVQTVNAFLSELDDGMSLYDRELLIHDYIIDICEYHSSVAEIESSLGNEVYFSVFGVLSEHKAVCEGYARTFQLLLNLAGVKCVGITGMGYGDSDEPELHMWNAVKLDDGWYFVDPTWDDQEDSFQRHDYFNLNTAITELDHTPSKLVSELSDEEINGDETFSAVAMNLFVPDCTQMTYNYIIRECPHLTDYAGGEVVDALYSAALNQERYFQFYVEPSVFDMSTAVEKLFKDSPQYFFNYIDTVNSRLDSYMIDTSAVSYVHDDVLSYIVVELNYY